MPEKFCFWLFDTIANLLDKWNLFLVKGVPYIKKLCQKHPTLGTLLKLLCLFVFIAVMSVVVELLENITHK
jgi:hypothetical protein